MKKPVLGNTWQVITILVSLTAVLLLSVACGQSIPGSDVATRVAEVQQVATVMSELEEVADAIEAEYLAEEAAAQSAGVGSGSEPPAATATPLPLPGPEVDVNRTFRYGSLDLTLLGWQLIGDTTSDGATCDVSFSNAHLAMRVHIVNTVEQAFTLNTHDLKVVDANNQPLNSLTQGIVRPANSSIIASDLEIPGKADREQVFCTPFNLDADPATMIWTWGNPNRAQVHVPLDPNGPADLGGYAEMPLDEQVFFKGAEITLSKAALTMGTWAQMSHQVQPEAGHRWLIVYVHVHNKESRNLFIETNEITLQVGNNVLGRQLPFLDMYRPGPYGMLQGLTAEGSLLFQVPEGTQQANLHFKAMGGNFDDDVLVPLDLSALQ